jgi:ubiquinone/menaquinone biosynthesis C-methylase UbiE
MSKTDQSRDSYNRKASNYENTADGRFTRPLRQLLLKSVNIKQNNRILDIACGTGDLISALAKKAPNTQPFGIDIAEQMIEVTKAANPNVAFSVSQAYPLPFKDSSMDVITVSAAFHHFEQPKTFACECMRVLSSGGTLYIGEFSYSPIARAIFNPLLPLLRAGDVKLYSEKELSSFFFKAGFEPGKIKKAGKCLMFSFEKRR